MLHGAQIAFGRVVVWKAFEQFIVDIVLGVDLNDQAFHQLFRNQQQRAQQLVIAIAFRPHGFAHRATQFFLGNLQSQWRKHHGLAGGKDCFETVIECRVGVHGT